MRVLTCGTFDRLHPGHLSLLNEALLYGKLWIILARDSTVRTVKGRVPEEKEEDRKKSLESAFPQASICLGDHENFFAPVKKILPDLLILGYDQSLPPGVSYNALTFPTLRLPPWNPHVFKSSLRRAK